MDSRIVILILLEFFFNSLITLERCVNLYQIEKIGNGNSYVAPDPLFISTVLLFANSLPWLKFEKFFKTKKIVDINATEQLTLLRLIALQEILCVNDEALLVWAKNQLYLFSFMQADFQPRLPTKKLLSDFRSRFDEVGLLKPFRKQCQRLIQEHENRFPPISVNNEIEATILKTQIPELGANTSELKDMEVSLPSLEHLSDVSCPNCGSFNNIKLSSSQVASSLPSISFSRCRFCGNTFRDNA